MPERPRDAVRLTAIACVAICAALFSGCIGTVGTPACAFDGDCSSGQICTAAICRAGTRSADGGVCPALQPKFADISANFFQVGCRVKDSNCHSGEAVQASSGLDLSGDSWGHLVGIRSLNQFGTCRCGDACVNGADAGCTAGPLDLVRAGDSAHSFLVIKLRELSSDENVLYGAGMPADHPGTTCEAAQLAIAQWIDQGAEKN